MGRGEGAALWTRETGRVWYCASAVEGLLGGEKARTWRQRVTRALPDALQFLQVVVTNRQCKTQNKIKKDAVHRLGRSPDTAGSHLEW